MQGVVDEFGRPVITLALRAPGTAVFHRLEGWIDTGCTGHLVLPKSTVKLLGLPRLGRLRAKLADGKEHSLATFLAETQWLEEVRSVEVLQTNGNYALVGLLLLERTTLFVNFVNRELHIQRPSDSTSTPS